MQLNLKVLVVDDFQTIRNIMKSILKKLGLTNIVEADNGSSALNVLQNHKIDLVFADCNMPGMSGIELLKAVRADENLKHIPFIMVTAEAQKARILEAIKAGVSAYVIKPFTIDIIKDRLSKIMPQLFE